MLKSSWKNRSKWLSRWDLGKKYFPSNAAPPELIQFVVADEYLLSLLPPKIHFQSVDIFARCDLVQCYFYSTAGLWVLNYSNTDFVVVLCESFLERFPFCHSTNYTCRLHDSFYDYLQVNRSMNKFAVRFLHAMRCNTSFHLLHSIHTFFIPLTDKRKKMSFDLYLLSSFDWAIFYELQHRDHCLLCQRALWTWKRFRYRFTGTHRSNAL